MSAATEDWLRMRNAQLERQAEMQRERLAAVGRIGEECRERARLISEGAGDREIRGSDLGRMRALLQVRAEGGGAMGKDAKWALGIAVTALVLVAFLPLVPVVLVLGAVED